MLKCSIGYESFFMLRLSYLWNSDVLGYTCYIHIDVCVSVEGAFFSGGPESPPLCSSRLISSHPSCYNQLDTNVCKPAYAYVLSTNPSFTYGMKSRIFVTLV